MAESAGTDIGLHGDTAGDGGQTRAAAAAPAGAAAPPPAAAAKAEAKRGKKKGKEGEVPLATLVHDDVMKWIRYTEAKVPIDQLKFYLRVEYGQIRPLKAQDVEARLVGFRNNLPTSRIKVTLWDFEVDSDGDGVPPFPNADAIQRTPF